MTRIESLQRTLDIMQRRRADAERALRAFDEAIAELNRMIAAERIDAATLPLATKGTTMSAAPDPQKCPAHGTHSTWIAVISSIGGVLVCVVFALLWDMRGSVCEMRGTLNRITVDVEQIKTAVSPAVKPAAMTETKTQATPCAVARPAATEYP